MICKRFMDDIKVTIHGDATSDQIKAIDNIGSHVRLKPRHSLTKALPRLQALEPIVGLARHKPTAGRVARSHARKTLNEE